MAYLNTHKFHITEAQGKTCKNTESGSPGSRADSVSDVKALTGQGAHSHTSAALRTHTLGLVPACSTELHMRLTSNLSEDTHWPMPHSQCHTYPGF